MQHAPLGLSSPSNLGKGKNVHYLRLATMLRVSQPHPTFYHTVRNKNSQDGIISVLTPSLKLGLLNFFQFR